MKHRIECVKEYLKRFGYLIVHLECDNLINLPYEFTEDIFSIIASDCVLKSLKLDSLPKLRHNSEFLTEFASFETLEHLDLKECIIDYSFNVGLSRFRYLRTLKICIQSMSNVALSNKTWKRLENLNRITEVYIKFSNGCRAREILMINIKF